MSAIEILGGQPQRRSDESASRRHRGGSVRQRVFVISAVIAWAELLRDWIDGHHGFQVVGIAADGEGGLRQVERLDRPPDIVLLDVGAPLALKTARLLRARDPAPRLVAMGLDENPSQVLSWAMARANGLVARTASLEELLTALTDVARGEETCSPGVTGALLRGVGNSTQPTVKERPSASLTDREREVAQLVVHGSTNKEIASRLQIELGTVKSHVHSVIRKLGVSRRIQVATELRDDDLA
jgi:two-component system nitrate/nitrite response regulator NarL